MTLNYEEDTTMVLSESINLLYAKHTYSLEGVGVKRDRSFNRVYFTRENAEKEMYRLMKKYSTHAVKVYEDNHDKTYVCDNGATFYICRA